MKGKKLRFSEIIRRYAKNLLFLSFILLTVWFLHRNQEKFYALRDVAAADIIVLSGFTFFTFLIMSFQFKILMGIFDIRLKVAEWFGLTMVNSMINYYMPARAGIIARAYYLKNRYGFSYSSYLCLLAGSYIIIYLISSFMALGITVLYYLSSRVFLNTIFYIAMILVIITIISFIIVLKIKPEKINICSQRFSAILRNAISGFSYFHSNLKSVLIVTVLYIIFIIASALRLYWAFRILDIQPDFMVIIIIQSLVVFSMFISITPGNLFLKEGIIGLLATTSSITLPEALLAASIDRLISILVVFVFGLAYSKYLLKGIDIKIQGS